MSSLELSEKHFIGRGGTKLVYRHPLDPELCVKFPRPEKKGTVQDIHREISYFKKHQDALPFLAPFLGTIETPLGLGYLYKMVRDEDGKISQDIGIFRKDAPKDLSSKISAIYHQCLVRKAVINDTKLDNILVSQKKSGDYTIYVVDGFGNPDFIKICDYSRFFLKLKLRRKFKKLCRKLNISDDFLD